jgi:serine protease AprX
MKIKSVLIFVFIFSSMCISAQKKFFVYLKDKNNSEFKITDPSKFLSARSIKRRTDQSISVINRDLPVNKTYVNQLKSTGAKILYTSKWMNAVLLETTDSVLVNIKKLNFVSSIEGNKDIRGAKNGANGRVKSKFEITENYDYGNSLSQIQQLGADIMHKKGFTGKNIMIGVFDSGFLNANTLDVFKTLFDEKRVINTFDFVDNETNVYNDDGHGTNVLGCIVGRADGKLIGTAPDAQVVLYRTEEVANESKLEEINWLLACERADSIGVDVINSSLGYNAFDDPTQDYKYADLTGDKTICAKAADWAVSTGIVVVVSAGNEGNKPWKYIATPADADSVIAVGAVDATGAYAAFSSVGPNAKNSIKPELAARGSNTYLASVINTFGAGSGTSFSSPLMAGFVASFKQAYPKLTAMKIRDILLKSGSQYAVPDNKLGYGIPNFEKAVEVIEGPKQIILGNEPFNDRIVVFPNPIKDFAKLSLEIDGKPIMIVDSDFEIYNLIGKKMDSKKIESGLYILKIKLNNRVFTSKVIKE